MKFVVVENEIRIREGLIKLVQKINPDYQMLGEAKDGIEGARMITEKDLIWLSPISGCRNLTGLEC